MKALLMAAAIVFAAGTTASAATIQFSDNIALQSTNFSETAFIQSFDSSLGTLTQVTVSLTGSASGQARAESEDASPTNVTLQLSATLTASLAGLADPLATALPVTSETVSFTTFDGELDFDGTSGVTLDDLSATNTDVQSYTDAATLAAFTDSGLLGLSVDASATSFGSGAGNLFANFSTSAAAGITVTYTFDEITAVPLPAGLPLMIASLGALGVLRMRRRA